MGLNEPQSEQYMRAVVEHLPGVNLMQYDRCGRQRAVDYLFNSGDVTGAVEITTITDRRAAAWSAKLADGQTIKCSSSRGWAVTVGLGTRLSELQRRLPPIVDACDHHRVDYPGHVPVTEWDDDLRWIVANHNNLRPSPAARPGTIRIDMPPTSGFPNDEGLERDLARLLCDDTIAAKLRKLSDHHGVSERHLAVGVMDIYAAGIDLLEHLLMGREQQIPKYQPVHDFPATHVWISGGSYAVLSWNRGDGWQWRTLPRPEQMQNA